MPRSRRPTRARVSDVYARRNARARELGYRSYYDYRAHDNGRIPPAGARLRGEALAEARGHRSAADLARTVRDGDLVVVSNLRRDPSSGRYSRLEVTVVDLQGRERVFRLTREQATAARLSALASRVEAAGATLAPPKSLNIRALGQELELVVAIYYSNVHARIVEVESGEQLGETIYGRGARGRAYDFAIVEGWIVEYEEREPPERPS